MPAVNPEILVWARETAGLTLQDAAAKVGIRDARGVAAVDRLAALERGAGEPTRPVLVRMARHYRRPLLAFYLSAPPPRAARGADFRTLAGPRSSETDALVDALVRNVRSRQQMVRAALEAEDEAEPLPFVGVLTDATPATDSPDDVFDPRPGSARRLQRLAARHLSQVLGHDLNAARYHEQHTPAEAFALLRSRAEDAGVFVLLKGDLGSHHTALPVEAFRGFAAADDVAPFVVVNDNDSEPAWSFTLLHELVHLLLGQTGISGARPGTGIEEFCNDVAAEWMLPARALDRIEIDLDRDVAERIGEFARPRNLSHTMVAYRLLRAGRIDQRTFDRLRADSTDNGVGGARRRVNRRVAPTTTSCAANGLDERYWASLVACWNRERCRRPRRPESSASSPRRSAGCFTPQGRGSGRRRLLYLLDANVIIIPDVCEDLQVYCCNTFDLVKALNFTTGWRR